MDTPPPARPDLGVDPAPPLRAQSSAGRTIAIVLASILGALVVLAFIILIAVTFIGKSASSQFEQIGNCVNGRNNPSCSSGFPSP
ncbi:MAG: hypothetical protein ACJ76A_01180 [Actinomycetota bacterium]